MCERVADLHVRVLCACIYVQCIAVYIENYVCVEPFKERIACVWTSGNWWKFSLKETNQQSQHGSRRRLKSHQVLDVLLQFYLFCKYVYSRNRLWNMWQLPTVTFPQPILLNIKPVIQTCIGLGQSVRKQPARTCRFRTCFEKEFLTVYLLYSAILSSILLFVMMYLSPFSNHLQRHCFWKSKLYLSHDTRIMEDTALLSLLK